MSVELPIAHGYKIKQHQGNPNTWDLYDPNDALIVDRFIHMYHMKQDPSGVLSLIHPGDLPRELRGKGLGVTSYLALAKHYGKIRSDESLTDDGAKVWERLVRDYGAEVISWDIEDRTKEDLERMYDNVSHDAKYDPNTCYTRFELTASLGKTNMKKLTTAQLIKVFAGELLKLSEHPKFRKEMEKRERQQKNEEILRKYGKDSEYTPKTPYEQKIYDKVNKIQKPGKIKPIDDDDLRDWLESYRNTDNVYDSFNLMLDRDLLDAAANYLKGAGVVENDEFGDTIIERLKKYTKANEKEDDKEIFRDIEIWVDSDTNENYFIPIDELDKYTVEGLDFDSGYDKNGKKYKVSILEKDAG